MKIAIVGPDGAGKTSTVNYLHKKIANSCIIYAGKNRNHRLITTTLGLTLWNLSRKYTNKKLSQLIRFFVFYPLEYAENLVRFGINDQNITCLFDRHPVDRMIMLYEYLSVFCPQNPSACRQKIGYILLKLLNSVYAHFFIKVDSIFFLLPETRVCFERSNGQYADPEMTEIKIQAYRKVSHQLHSKQPLKMLEISAKQRIDEIGDLILNEIDASDT